MQSINHHTTKSHEFPKGSLGLEMRRDDGLLTSRVAMDRAREEEMQNGGSSTKLPASSAAVGAESFRSVHSVYYAGATGNVPFLWESRPGTPKHASNDSSIPPLTPPPSYSYSKSKAQNSPAHKKRGNSSYKHPSSSTFFSIMSLPSVLPRRSRNNDAGVTPKSTPSSLSSASVNSSSTSSSSMSPAGTPRLKKKTCRPRRRTMFSRRRSDQLFADTDDGDQEEAGGREGSPYSPFCFGGGPSCSTRNKGRYTVRRALSSIVWGHRSSRTVICTS